MKKLIGLMLVSLFAISSVLAMNIWITYTIFDDIQVQQGFKGLYKVQFCDAGCFNQYMAKWGTRDNETYQLTVTADGEGGKFFKDLPRKTVQITGDGISLWGSENTTDYRYDVTLSVPRGTAVGLYPYSLCGKVCDKTGKTITMCLQACKNGNVNVSELN